MDINEESNKYLSIDKKFIKGNKDNPIKSRETFYKILKVWLLLNENENDKTGKSPSGNGFINNFWIQLGSRNYHLNSDTPRRSVNEFYKNKDNHWKIIPNRNGVENLVTNSIDGEKIDSLFLYYKKI